MGVFSSIFNADNINKFNYLYDNYYRGAKYFYECALNRTSQYRLYNKYSDRLPPFSRDIDNWMKNVVVMHESAVKDIDKDFVQEDHKKEIISLAQKYPRAYLYFCKVNGISDSALYSVDKSSLSFPGQISSVAIFSARKKDIHFETMIKKELEGYPKISIIDPSIFRVSPQRSYKTGWNDSLVESLVANHGLSIIGPITVTFKEIREVTILYPLISQFEGKEKEINNLLRREHLWMTFEKNIILNPIGEKYYKSFFFSKYGTEDVPLSVYEELAKNPAPLNDFISKKEESYIRMKKRYPNGTIQFEKLHPLVPHSEYNQYEKEVREIEVQSKYVKYPEHQNELSSIIMSKIAGKTSWTFEQQDVQCHIKTYDHETLSNSCKMVFSYHQVLFDKVLNNDWDANMAGKYPHCKDFMNLDSLESMMNSGIISLFGLLTEVLVPLLDSWLSIVPTVCIVYDNAIDDIYHIINDYDYSSFFDDMLMNSISKKKAFPNNGVKIISSSHLGCYHPDHVPYIFILWAMTPEQVSVKLSELANSFLVSSIVSVYKVINEEQLEIIESSRKKEEDEIKKRRVLEIKREYPEGFIVFCNKHGISIEDYVFRYTFIMNSINEIKQIQLKENERKRETERKNHESSIITYAHNLILNYPNAAKECGYLSNSVLDFNSAQSILTKEALWKDLESIFYKRFALFSVASSLQGLPHKYFYDYYPSNKFPDSKLTIEQRSHRVFIWGFKDGKEPFRTKAIEIVSDFINHCGLRQYANKLILVCSPASSNLSNSFRFCYFSQRVCRETGLINGFEHIKLTSIALPKNKGGNGCVEFEAESTFFAGKFVVLFDDIVTSGGTIYSVRHRIERAGARVIGIISLGQTRSVL